MDRFPRKELFDSAREATRRHGTALMICRGPFGSESTWRRGFGGNGRSEGLGKAFWRLLVVDMKSTCGRVDARWLGHITRTSKR